MSDSPQRPTVEQIEAFLVAKIATMAQLPVERVVASEPIATFGVDSAHALELIVAVEEWLGLELPDDLAWRYPTIQTIARELAVVSPTAP